MTISATAFRGTAHLDSLSDLCGFSAFFAVKTLIVVQELLTAKVAEKIRKER
jgi:hypothetical protein